jgi:RNA polymerase sigma-70 factor, ECF subfamily
VRTGATRDDLDRRARFEAVVGVVYEPLQRYLHRRTTSHDASDVLADTLLVVWRRLDDVPTEPLPWCYGVARRTLANHRRRDERQLRLVGQIAAQPGTTSTAADPQSSVEQNDPDLDAAIATLTDSEADIVRLWAWERLEPREIAAVLELTPNAVSVALSRAKRKLTEHLAAAARRDAPPGRQDQPPAGHLRGEGATETTVPVRTEGDEW